MFVLYIIIPIMALAVAVAVVPVLVGSVRHNRAMRQGRVETTASATEEALFWHRMLGHRRGTQIVETPDMIPDAEVTRVIANPSDRVTVDSRSAWTVSR
jgi:hypothetical protein